MRNWEKKYEEYQNSGLDNKIAELENDLNTKDKYKELKKYNRIKDNLPAVKNILEYRDNCKIYLKTVDAELVRRKELNERIEKRNIELNKEIEKLNDSLKESQEKLSNIRIVQENKEKSMQDRQNLIYDISNKNKELSEKHNELYKNQEILKNDTGNSKIDKRSDSELNSLAVELNSRISKCNMVARNLINGYSWNKVELNLDNWKEQTVYKRRKDLDETTKDTENREENYNKELESAFNDKEENKIRIEEISERLKKNFGNQNGDDWYKNEKHDLPDNTFNEKHPILAKIKGIFEKIKNRFSRDEIRRIREDEAIEKNSNAISKEIDKLLEQEELMRRQREEREKKETGEKQNTKQNTVEEINEDDLKLDKNFKQQLRKLANVPEVEKEQLREKLAKLQEKNRENEAKKFGAGYAKQSSIEKNEQDIEGR